MDTVIMVFVGYCNHHASDHTYLDRCTDHVLNEVLHLSVLFDHVLEHNVLLEQQNCEVNLVLVNVNLFLLQNLFPQFFELFDEGLDFIINL